jgi:NTE family protein
LDRSDFKRRAPRRGTSADSKTRALWSKLRRRITRWARKPAIGLALGSGATWGVAHIGVLSVFKELNIPISFLSGSSAGSFVGALYAGGVEGEDLEACGREYRWRDVGRFNYFPKISLATNDRMEEYLRGKIGTPNFEDLRIPFYVAATNLTTGQLKIFREGPVIPAVRASCAIPGIFAPVEIDGELYCDGGLLRKIPCRVLREAGADFVIGVELSRFHSRGQPVNIFEVITHAIDIALIHQAESDLRAADLVIRPDVSEMTEFGFNQNETLIERGKFAASNELLQWPQLRKLMDRPAGEAVERSTMKPLSTNSRPS